MLTLTVTKEFNDSLIHSTINGHACLVSTIDNLIIGLDDKPYTPIGGRSATKSIIKSGFVIGSKLTGFKL